MNITLCNIPIELKTDLKPVEKEWQSIFSLHQADSSYPKIIVEALPIDEAPAYDPSLSIRMFNEGVNAYSLAYSSNTPSVLTLANEAIICLPNIHLSSFKEETSHVQLYVTQKHIDHKQVEDLSLTALAPMLRRFGIYIAHAFGVADLTQAEALLIIGPSGSGKTTTGLSFIEQGWHYLGNDAVLLSENEKREIVAWPSPGNLNISPKTFELLDLSVFNQNDAEQHKDGKFHYPPNLLPHIAQHPVPVIAQLFPTLSMLDGESQAQRIPAGVALSQIMAQSIDNWDSATFEAHFGFLETLTRQTQNIQTRNSLDPSSVLPAIDKVLFSNG